MLDVEVSINGEDELEVFRCSPPERSEKLYLLLIV